MQGHFLGSNASRLQGSDIASCYPETYRWRLLIERTRQLHGSSSIDASAEFLSRYHPLLPHPRATPSRRTFFTVERSLFLKTWVQTKLKSKNRPVLRRPGCTVKMTDGDTGRLGGPSKNCANIES